MFEQGRMEHYASSTASESPLDTPYSIFLDPNQYLSSDLFNLGMIPTLNDLGAYHDYRDFTECSSEPYIAAASVAIAERPLSHLVGPMERVQTGARLPYSTSNEFDLGENQTIAIQQDAGNKTDTAASEEANRNLAREKLRLKNKKASAKFRERKKAQVEALEGRVEILLKRQSELEKQLWATQEENNALTLRNETITRENARLCLIVNNKVTRVRNDRPFEKSRERRVYNMNNY